MAVRSLVDYMDVDQWNNSRNLKKHTFIDAIANMLAHIYMPYKNEPIPNAAYSQLKPKIGDSEAVKDIYAGIQYFVAVGYKVAYKHEMDYLMSEEHFNRLTVGTPQSYSYSFFMGHLDLRTGEPTEEETDFEKAQRHNKAKEHHWEYLHSLQYFGA